MSNSRLVQQIVATDRSNFRNLLVARQTQVAKLNEKYWTIIGSGSIGDKAEELMRKTWAIIQAGFVANPRTVLAMGFFEGFKERNGINAAVAQGASPNEIQQLIRNGTFNEQELAIINSLDEKFKGTPVAVRSSAYGDSRGTGTYQSEFCIPLLKKYNDEFERWEIKSLVDSIKNVLESEFSLDAITFRKDKGLAEGMAIIIEPVYGQAREDDFWKDYSERPETKPGDFEKNYFAPAYGGLAYTSTSQGKGYVKICPGLGLKTVSKSMKKIEEDELRKLKRIILKTRDDKKGEAINLKYGGVSEIDVPDNAIQEKNLVWLFEKLKKLENLIGKPQYIEFAIIEENGEPQVTILQIADVNINTDFYDFSNPKDLLFRAEYVKGKSGIFECGGIVVLIHRFEVEELIRFNETHSNYIVFYPSDFVSEGRRSIIYPYINNARVLSEVGGEKHDDDAAEHWKGLLAETGKLLIVQREFDLETLAKIKARAGIGNNTTFKHIRFRVTASERQQKAIVELIE
ncbi:MAG: PEP/pyruvate-binding domain-containing protein [Candidatus Micrarchaeota archaeon]